MKRIAMTRALGSGLLLAALLGLAGCVEYTIETTVRPDGSGLRTEKMEVGQNEEVQVSPADFVDMMYAGADQGWTHHPGVDEKGDSIQVLERRIQIPDLSAWSRLDDRVQIAAAPGANASRTLGYVRLGDVRFRNSVEVGTGTLSDGGTSFSYRETFSWEDGVDVIVEFLMTDLDRTLAAKYPALPDYERGEVVGFARARLWVAVNGGYFQAEGSEEDRLITTAIDRSAEHGIKIVRLRYPGESEAFLRETMRQLYAENDEPLEQFLTGTAPGLNLAVNTEIRFRLRMPGEVTSSNAHETDGNTLLWSFGPMDALSAPVEIQARSVLRR